jgi:hypothetical protein
VGEYGEAADGGCGSDVLAGVSAIEMLKATKQMLSQGDGWQNPFGDGNTSNFIMDYIAIKYVSFKYKIK